MVLGSTQPLTEMSTRNIPWGKGGQCLELTTLQPSCADCHKIWKPQRTGTLRACQDLYWDCFTFTFTPIYTFITCIATTLTLLYSNGSSGDGGYGPCNSSSSSINFLDIMDFLHQKLSPPIPNVV
jgi:hypothetical protein